MAKAKKTFVKKEETVALLQPKKKSRLRLGKKGLFALSSLILILVAVALFLYLQYQGINPLTKDPKAVSTTEVKSLLEKINKLIILPEGEDPRIATVTDVAKLADQPFFAKAQNGDRVLIYQQAAKVILYRPSINKLIDVAPLNTNIAQDEAASAAAKAQEPATITILNGTLTSGLARNAQSKIAASLPNITVSRVGDAAAGSYEGTLVIDVSGNKKAQAVEVAKLLGGKVETTVPEGEITPTADLLIILGADYKN